MRTITKPSKFEDMLYKATCPHCGTEYTYEYDDVRRKEVSNPMANYNPDAPKQQKSYTMCPTCCEESNHGPSNEVKPEVNPTNGDDKSISELTEKS